MLPLVARTRSPSVPSRAARHGADAAPDDDPLLAAIGVAPLAATWGRPRALPDTFRYRMFFGRPCTQRIARRFRENGGA